MTDRNKAPPEDTLVLYYVLDEHGNPIPEPDASKFAEFLHCDRKLAVDNLPNDITVSTVFTGIDYSFTHLMNNKPHAPLLWETMIFGGKHDQYQQRYASKEAALKGHARAKALALKDADN